MKLALVALAAVLLLALLLVGRRRVTGVKRKLSEIRPVPMVIEPEWSEPAIDDDLTTIVAEPVMEATKSRPGWLSRNKYKVGLGGLSLLAFAAAKQSPWRSMPRPSFRNFKARQIDDHQFYDGTWG
jgi:hypothetical protein